jgi:hypothetical protein
VDATRATVWAIMLAKANERRRKMLDVKARVVVGMLPERRNVVRTCTTPGGMQREELGEGRKRRALGLLLMAALTWTDGARLRDAQLPKRAVVSSVARLECDLNRRASRTERRRAMTLSAKAETAATVGSRTLDGLPVGVLSDLSVV